MEFLVSSGSTRPIDLEFFFLDEDEDGGILRFIALDGEEFACYDASCRPPTSGGTGGSRKKGGGTAAEAATAARSNKLSPKGNYLGKTEHANDVGENRAVGGVRDDGILSEPWLNEKGEVVLTEAQIKSADKALAKLGTSFEEWKANISKVGQAAMDNDPEQALRDAKWYKHEHDTWGKPLADEFGMGVDQIMGIASAMSTNKRWDGVENNNKIVTARLLKLLKDDIEITITPQQAADYAQFSIDKATKGGKYGPRTIESGTYKMSELSSGVLARVMGKGYQIGGKYFTDGLFKAFAIARGELEPNVAIGSLKQRSFVNNLSHPDINYSSTNDFWMARALFGPGKLTINSKGGTGDMTIREWEVTTGDKPNSFLGSKGAGDSALFAYATKATKEALSELALKDPRFEGMMVHEFQAVVWVQMQREYASRGWLGGDDE